MRALGRPLGADPTIAAGASGAAALGGLLALMRDEPLADARARLGLSADSRALVIVSEGVTDPAEAGRLVSEGFVPLLRQVSGFVAYYWVDAGDGVMVSTSVFQDQAGAEESIERAAQFVRDNLASLLPNPPQVTAGEVVASA